MTKIAVISLSGGMDSTCLLIRLLKEGYYIFSLSFDYGQKHKKEIEVLLKNIDYLKKNGYTIKHKIIDISGISNILDSSLISGSKEEIPIGHYEEENMKSTVVPNRNAIFSSIIYGYAISLFKKYLIPVDVFLGVHAGDHTIYPDCRPEFYMELEQSFKIGNWDSEKVNFVLPYISLNKTDILQDCLKNSEILGLNFDTILGNTLTSYNAVDGVSTGTSGSDIERIEAFINIGRKDPIPYVRSWKEIVENVKAILQK